MHKVYINAARKIYMNVYLFEKNVSPLQSQKNNRELETIIQESIMLAIRESIPTEAIIRAYMDESVEQEEQVFIENIEEPEETKEEQPKESSHVNTSEGMDIMGDEQPKEEEEQIPDVVPSIQNVDNEEVVTKLTFNDIDSVLEKDDNVQEIDAPKTIERLEDISTTRALQRKLEEEEDSDEERIQISTEPVDLTGFDILDEPNNQMSSDDVLLNDVEELPPI